jgi:hypothetical protein
MEKVGKSYSPKPSAVRLVANDNGLPTVKSTSWADALFSQDFVISQWFRTRISEKAGVLLPRRNIVKAGVKYFVVAGGIVPGCDV